MSTFRKHLMVIVVASLALFFGSVRETRGGVMETAHPRNCLTLPVVKNLTGLKAQPVCNTMGASHELTRGEANRLAATANSAEDHLTVARFFRAEASGLDAQAAGYEEAAAKLQNGPAVKNFGAPTTAGRFAWAANGLREQAKTDRALAASHEKMASTVVAALD